MTRLLSLPGCCPAALGQAALIVACLLWMIASGPRAFAAESSGASSSAQASTQASASAPAHMPPARLAPTQAVYLIPLRGAIGPATTGFVMRAMTRATLAGAQLIVLELDTPGGLDVSMRELIQAIVASPVPVATFVYPGGARAASAGTYILYASHIAAMAPGTNLGAASPIQIGIGGKPAGREPGDGPGASAPAAPPQDTMERKQMHDASAYLRGLAQLRGRNAEWGERAVRDAVSLSADEAVAQKVADLVVPNVPSLLQALDGRRVDTAAGPRTLHTLGAPVAMLEPDWRARLLAVIADPSVALILMMLGIYALIFEFSTPGMVLPGVAGGILLLVGLFALQMLPLNFAGLALVALGTGCMVAEAFLPSFGALGIGGVMAFAIGAVMLVDTDVPGFGVPYALIGMLAATTLLVSFGISALALRARRAPVVSGDANLVGSIGEIVESKDGEIWALVRGENWRVRDTGVALPRGQRIRVTGRRGLVLEVEARPARTGPKQPPPPH